MQGFGVHTSMWTMSWASRNPDGATEFLRATLDKTAAIGAEALSGEAEVMGNGLPFLSNKARQYGLI